MFERVQELSERAQRKSSYIALGVAEKLGLAPPRDKFLGTVGYLRLLQNRREKGVKKNPDDEVWRFLSPIERYLVRIEDMEWPRGWAFYHFLLARTRFYDEALKEALAGGFKQLFIFGVGTDTRAQRFRTEIDKAGMRVIETDLPAWIDKRAAVSRRLETPKDYHLFGLDLNAADISTAVGASVFDTSRKTLFIAEAVAQYLEPKTIQSLLAFTASAAPGSHFAFDFKYAGACEDGPVSYFRPSREPDRMRELLEQHGYELRRYMSSETAQEKYAPYAAARFCEDAIIVAETLST